MRAAAVRHPPGDRHDRPLYTEWSPWPGWLQVVFWGGMAIGMAVVWAAGEERVVGLVVLVVTVIAVQAVLAGLSVRLYRDEMVVGLGPIGIIRKKVRYDEIVRTEAVTYRPLIEFGGWGVRWGRNGKRAWTARGNLAVVLHLRDGTQLYVGSDTPHRLEERIRTVAGARIRG